MGEDTRQLIELIELVADGRADLDWDALVRDAPDESVRLALRELGTIAGVAKVHATQVADSSSDASDTATQPVAVAAISAAAPLGTWGNFLLTRKVGEGAYGEVYEAIDTLLDHRVALKLLKPFVDKSAILHEAKLLIGLRHPNVVAVHGADVREGRVGFWMDFIEGRTLAQIVRSEHVRSASEAAVIGQDLCRALAAVHSVGIIHRDIKAQNVMRESGGRIVLMDFGAGEFRDRTKAPVRAAGTPLYLARELFDGERASVQSDIYALGVLLFFLVSGSYPIPGTTLDEIRRAHDEGMRRRLDDLRPDLPDEFVATVETMLSPNPQQRFATAGQARAALEQSIAPSLLPPPIPTPHEDDQRNAGYRLFAVTVAVAIVIGGIAVLGAISTASYNLAFGRTGAFGVESPFDWFVWGLRSLASAIYRIGSGIIVLTAAVTATRMLCRLIPSVGARVRRFAQRCAAGAAKRELNDPNLLLQLVVLAGVLMMAALVFAYRSQVTAFAVDINTAPPQELAALQPDRGSEYSDYSRILERVVLLYGFATYGVYRVARRAERRVDLPIKLIAIAVPVLAFVTLRAAPYRIVFRNEAERVDLQDTRCYRIGSAQGKWLLHCPDVAKPRNVIVDATDPRLRPRGVIESVFTPPGDSHPLEAERK